MEPREITERKETSYWDGMSLDDIAEEIEMHRKEGYEKLSLDVYEYSLCAYFVRKRMETSEEVEKRVMQAKEAKESRRRMYEKLRAEFEHEHNEPIDTESWG